MLGEDRMFMNVLRFTLSGSLSLDYELASIDRHLHLNRDRSIESKALFYKDALRIDCTLKCHRNVIKIPQKLR